MIKTFQEFFAPPIFEDEDKTRVASHLNLLIKFVLAILIIAIPKTILSYTHWMLFSYLLAVLVTILAMGLLKKGYVRPTAYIVICSFWMLGNYSALVTGGVRAVGFGANLLFVFMAGMLISLRAAMFFGVSSLLLGLGMAVAQTRGLIPPIPDTVTAYTVWITQAFLLIFLSGLLYITVNDIKKSLKSARQAEIEKGKLIENLEQRNAELERLAYTLSHELKSPLLTIRGFMGYLREDALSGNVVRLDQDVQRINSATNTMLRLINELIDLMSLGRILNNFEDIPLRELVDESIDQIHEKIVERKISFHITDNLPIVYGDRKRLLEVFQNLFENSIKFMGNQPDPQIQVGQRNEQDGANVFYVRDNGIGIEPRFADRIFGIFHKLDSQSEGTGIGLALVKRVIELHRGRIWVESELGKGATFYFTLPHRQE